MASHRGPTLSDRKVGSVGVKGWMTGFHERRHGYTAKTVLVEEIGGGLEELDGGSEAETSTPPSASDLDPQKPRQTEVPVSP